MPSVRYEILLPLHYNDGTPIEDERFQQTWTELVERFGAVTIEPQSLQGIWTQQVERYEDELKRLIVDVADTPATKRFFESYKETLKQRFSQVDIWIAAYPVRII